jgi:hypothetical protein
MTDLAADLRQRFDWARDVCLEAYEVLPDGRSFERSDEDERAIGIFDRLIDTVVAIPQALIASAEQLRRANPEFFERRLEQVIGAVGAALTPADAAQFLDEVLHSAG